MNYKVLIAALLAGCVAQPPVAFEPLPVKWVADAGGGPAGVQCESGVDGSLQRAGQRNLSIVCHAALSSSIHQTFEAAPLWGKRVRFSAWIKTKDIDPAGVGGKAGAGLYVEAAPRSDQPITDFMTDQRVAGSSDWQYRELEMVVPREGAWLVVGLWIRGKGQVWARDLKFEQISATDNATAAIPPGGVAAVPLSPLPPGWSVLGNGGPLRLPGRCEIGVDSQKQVGTMQPFSVHCVGDLVPSFGGAKETIDSSQYRGKRVRISAWLKTDGVEGVNSPQYAPIAGEAGLWLGMGSVQGGMRMDRMQERAVKGTTDWQYRDFVADVPVDSRQMMIGYWMQGKGQLWVRDLTVEEVPASVPLNFLWTDPKRPAGPDLSLQ
ncbi:MAG TPA: hypothetical protein VMH77_00195 [Steroidobacteraceae bacterium]|nr:hypothetical protein [Steroidobacteraceae bacterium]